MCCGNGAVLICDVGRVLALDLTSTLRDVRMLSSCGSADALAEAWRLLLTLRRAQQLCRQRHEEEKQLNEEHRELRRFDKEKSETLRSLSAVVFLVLRVRGFCCNKCFGD